MKGYHDVVIHKNQGPITAAEGRLNGDFAMGLRWTIMEIIRDAISLAENTTFFSGSADYPIVVGG